VTPAIRVCVATVAFIVASPATTEARDAVSGYPNRAVRLVNSGITGGTVDIPARALADKLRERFGQSIVVENRPAAGGTLAVAQVAKAAPDGYTLIYSFSGPLAFAPHLYPSLPYDVQKDFTPVIFIGRVPFVLAVSATSDISNIQELIEAARKQPGKLNYSSVGNGSGTHLAMELFKSETRIALSHVPYNGGIPAATALASGQAQATFLPPALLLAHVQLGRVKIIGVASRERLPQMPTVPTVAESGLPGFESDGWHGILAPAGTPRDIVLRLNKEINDALAAPEVREIFARTDTHAVGGTPEQFGRLIASESKKWAAVIRSTGARVD
jgi:tripartite-type tricarboxylate transporter receptor subunit TctC